MRLLVQQHTFLSRWLQFDIRVLHNSHLLRFDTGQIQMVVVLGIGCHLHEVTGGWWTWSQSDGRPDFVTTQEWLQIYANARKRKSKKKQD